MRIALRAILNHLSAWAGLGLLVVSITIPLVTTSAQSISEQAKDLESAAKKDYPNKGYSDSVRQEAFKQAEALNKGAKSDEERIQQAIGEFFGFYLVNTRSHVTYCTHLGVDISPFTKVFVAVNKAMYEQSSKLLYRRGMTEEQLFKQWEADLDSMTTKNFADLAASDRLTTTQECQIQIQGLDARIARVTFSKIMPEVSKTLLDAQ